MVSTHVLTYICMTHTLTRTGGAYVRAKRHDRANSTNTKTWCQKQKRKKNKK